MSQSDLPRAEFASMPRSALPVALTRTELPLTKEVAFWGVIRSASERISFNEYEKVINRFCCGTAQELTDLRRQYNLPFWRVDAYELLKSATDLFLRMRCGLGGELNWVEIAGRASAAL